MFWGLILVIVILAILSTEEHVRRSARANEAHLEIERARVKNAELERNRSYAKECEEILRREGILFEPKGDGKTIVTKVNPNTGNYEIRMIDAAERVHALRTSGFVALDSSDPEASEIIKKWKSHRNPSPL
jgi:hypothetical protein